MEKFIAFLLIPLISLGLAGCDDSDDVAIINLDLLDGTWEVVSQDDPYQYCIYDITTAPDFTEGSYGGLYGKITTYYLSVSGVPVYDREYSWTIREVENHQPLLDLVLVGELNDDDHWDGMYYYKITKLTPTEMWWRGNSNGDNGVVKFVRRTDIK